MLKRFHSKQHNMNCVVFFVRIFYKKRAIHSSSFKEGDELSFFVSWLEHCSEK